MAKPKSTALVDPKAAKLPMPASGSLPYVGNQQSVSGTPRYRDVSRPDDYVTELADPYHRMAVFEEMRLSDDGVQSAIAARGHMITASNWKITAPDDSDQAREITEFCEDNIYPVLDDTLRWLGAGGLQYGFGLIEPVYQYADAPAVRNITRRGINLPTRNHGRRIYLSKVAHVRQRTVYTFLLAPTGDLTGIRQYAYNGTSFQMKDLDPGRMVLWTYNREGDDYWGVPPTRHVYKAWTLKTQIERLNVLGIDRFGVGTPVGEAGPGWEDADYALLDKYLSNWRSGANTFLVHPAGGKVEIVSGDGSMMMSLLNWVKYYNLAITKAFYTQGSELGSTETGARALGDTMLEQAETLVQSDDESLAALLNERLIVPLVDLNFGPQAAYPRFIPSQRVRASSALFTAIMGFIAANGLNWRPEDEAWLRDAMELPEVPIVELQAAADAKGALAQQAADAATAAAKNPAQKPGQPALPKEKSAKESTVKAATVQAEVMRRNTPAHFSRPRPTVKPDAALSGESWRNPEYTAWEATVLKPDIVNRDLALQQTRLAAEVHEALRGVDVILANLVESYAAEGLDSLTQAVRKIAVPASARNKLRAVISRAADRARAYGMQAVETETARQDGSGDASSADPTRSDSMNPNLVPVVAPTFADETPAEQKRASQIQAEIDAAVENEVSRREAAARSAASYAIHSTPTGDVAALKQAAKAQAVSNLEELSAARTEDNVGGVINTAFGAGRQDGADAILANDPNGIVAKVYSAVMDGGTCDSCAAYDGATFPPDYPEDASGVQAPNPKCDGTFKRCRCVWILITSAEIPSAVPASKGPVVAGFPY